MKVQAFGLACLLGGVLAAPTSEQQATDTQQMQPAGHEAVDFSRFAPAPEDIDFEGLSPAPQDADPEGMTLTGAYPMDMEAFAEMVQEVEAQVQQIIELMRDTNAADPNAVVSALVAPLAEVDSTLARGVSRVAIPGLGALVGGLTGAATGNKKPGVSLTLVGDLLHTVATLLENVLTRGPIGELLNGLLGGVLGGVTGTVEGLLNGDKGVSPTDAAAELAKLVEGILGSLGQLLPGVGATVGGVVSRLPGA